jgi:hypothetical protein
LANLQGELKKKIHEVMKSKSPYAIDTHEDTLQVEVAGVLSVDQEKLAALWKSGVEIGERTTSVSSEIRGLVRTRRSKMTTIVTAKFDKHFLNKIPARNMAAARKINDDSKACLHLKPVVDVEGTAVWWQTNLYVDFLLEVCSKLGVKIEETRTKSKIEVCGVPPGMEAYILTQVIEKEKERKRKY